MPEILTPAQVETILAKAREDVTFEEFLQLCDFLRYNEPLIAELKEIGSEIYGLPEYDTFDMEIELKFPLEDKVVVALIDPQGATADVELVYQHLLVLDSEHELMRDPVRTINLKNLEALRARGYELIVERMTGPITGQFEIFSDDLLNLSLVTLII